jgi:O-antigen/teichoic acid export membrane protein
LIIHHAPNIYINLNIKIPGAYAIPWNHHAQKKHSLLNTFQNLIKPTEMQKKIRSLYTDPLYRNSLALMLNSAISAFFGLLFWIVAARTMPAKDIGLATAAISAAALIVGLSKLGLDAGLVRYLPESKNKNGLYSTIVMITLILALVLTAVFMLGINIFSPALSFLHDGWFLPVFFAYIAVTSINSLQNLAFISIRRADLSLIQNLLLGGRIPILCF